MTLFSKLEKLGLSKEEAKLFVLCSKEPLSPTDLSRKLKIPRTTCYILLEKMLVTGLLEKSQYGKRILYGSAPIEKAVDLLLQQQKARLAELKQIGNELIESDCLHKQTDVYKTIYDMDAYEVLSKEILRDNQDIYWFGDFSLITNLVGINRFYKEFSSKRMRGKTTAFALSDSYIKHFKKLSEEIGEFRKMKVVNFSPKDALFCIWGEKIAFVYSQENRTKFLVIRKKSIAQLIKMLFQGCWERIY